ncbi:hypothetical protein F5Y14DRAFT_270817 [Nemania sp. NC0429]|nr:hypothetical protein F5Y14DRAFT_270817 [Nemania sp. NC0429]
MAATGESLSVIALISGGKDSFYSILHCQANGHRVVALANLYPSGTTTEDAATITSQHDSRDEVSASRQQGTFAKPETGDADVESNNSEADLNSFMYQTVGHQLIPLYAQATGLPLYRQAIVGTAVHHGLSYENPRRQADSEGEHEPEPGQKAALELEAEEDETESLVPLLRSVLDAHPEANALCTGAILSTYQRTRVESVALRLGLVPLSYLWQFTELPAGVPSSSCHDQVTGLTERVRRGGHGGVGRHARRKGRDLARDDARLLRDMAAVGLEARIVKVASAGLDEGFLWENVASEAGVQRVERAMRRFGAAAGRGAILGEGGEFETLVLDGPPSLFRARIVPSDEGRRVVREGGGCAWLSFRRANVVPKREDELERAGELQGRLAVRIPGLLDPRFEDTIRRLLDLTAEVEQEPGSPNPSLCHRDTKPAGTVGPSASSDSIAETDLPKRQLPLSPQSSSSQEWRYLGSSDGAASLTVQEQTVSIVGQIRRQLDEHALSASAITNSVIVLRHMSDFPIVNQHYGSLFHEPNPPSRVTISCGDGLLPRDAAIAVYLTVHLHLPPQERRGLHVQSRSYWAPANIGPYSQAIAFPLSPLPATEASTREEGEYEDEDEDEDDDDGQQHSLTRSSPVAVSIAGQIPLLPASMALPLPSEPHHLELQITLALQHLWRVGVEMQVRWWTSAVAYFPATSSTETMRRQALLAGAAWEAAHLWPELDNADKDSDQYAVSDNDSDDDDGPDLWDRRFNAQFMTYGGGDEEESFPLSLPNWSAVRGFDAASSDDTHDAEVRLRNKMTKIPFFFAAEVEELPRQAGVEWHAHLGLADLRPESVVLHTTRHVETPSHEVNPLDISFYHVIVDSGDGVFVQTTAVLRPSADRDESQGTSVSADALQRVFAATANSLEKLFSLESRLSVSPKIIYAAAALQLADDHDDDDQFGGIGALVPCHSLWDSQGRRLSAVCIFETRFS